MAEFYNCLGQVNDQINQIRLDLAQEEDINTNLRDTLAELEKEKSELSSEVTELAMLVQLTETEYHTAVVKKMSLDREIDELDGGIKQAKRLEQRKIDRLQSMRVKFEERSNAFKAHHQKNYERYMQNPDIREYEEAKRTYAETMQELAEKTNETKDLQNELVNSKAAVSNNWTTFVEICVNTAANHQKLETIQKDFNKLTMQRNQLIARKEAQSAVCKLQTLTKHGIKRSAAVPERRSITTSLTPMLKRMNVQSSSSASSSKHRPGNESTMDKLMALTRQVGLRNQPAQSRPPLKDRPVLASAHRLKPFPRLSTTPVPTMGSNPSNVTVPKAGSAPMNSIAAPANASFPNAGTLPVDRKAAPPNVTVPKAGSGPMDTIATAANASVLNVGSRPIMAAPVNTRVLNAGTCRMDCIATAANASVLNVGTRPIMAAPANPTVLNAGTRRMDSPAAPPKPSVLNSEKQLPKGLDAFSFLNQVRKEKESVKFPDVFGFGSLGSGGNLFGSPTSGTSLDLDGGSSSFLGSSGFFSPAPGASGSDAMASIFGFSPMGEGSLF